MLINRRYGWLSENCVFSFCGKFCNSRFTELRYPRADLGCAKSSTHFAEFSQESFAKESLYTFLHFYKRGFRRVSTCPRQIVYNCRSDSFESKVWASSRSTPTRSLCASLGAGLPSSFPKDFYEHFKQTLSTSSWISEKLHGCLIKA